MPLTISELAGRLRGEGRLDRAAVVVTFDGGHVSTHDAVRALLHHDVSSTVVMISDRSRPR